METILEKHQPVCLQFANTLEWHASEHPLENLATANALLDWAQRIDLLTPTQIISLKDVISRDPKKAESWFRSMKDFREVIYRVFAAIAHQNPPDPKDLFAITRINKRLMHDASLVKKDDHFEWGWKGKDPELDSILWLMVQSSLTLLSSPDLRHVKECADDRGCGWLFLDTTRNHSRVWCDMKDCGNRAKAHRYYLRIRKSDGTDRK